MTLFFNDLLLTDGLGVASPRTALFPLDLLALSPTWPSDSPALFYLPCPCTKPFRCAIADHLFRPVAQSHGEGLPNL